MKLPVSVMLFYVTTLLTSNAMADKACSAAVASAWRGTFSEPMTQGLSVQTSPGREKAIELRHEEMVKELKGQLPGISSQDTPHMSFFAEAGLTQSEMIPSVYGSGKTPTIKVSGLGTQATSLKGTILLPVSGHTGFANAVKWSTTDRFDLTMSQGPIQRSSNPAGATHLINQQLSKDLITAMELDIPLTQNADGTYEPVNLFYYRLGVKQYMGAPGGYWEGRVLTIQVEP